MINSIAVLWLLTVVIGQDALLAPEAPFAFALDEQATYHQSFLVEIDAELYRQDWNIIYVHQSAQGRSVIDLELIVVQKQYPERQGAVLSKCRLEDQARRWCRIETQGVNFRSFLIKVNMDCVSDCKSNVTIGFTSRDWNGKDLPPVRGYQLETSSPVAATSNEESEKKIVLAKIVGWMVFTLVLILLAIKIGEKVANSYDRKMEEQRQ